MMSRILPRPVSTSSTPSPLAPSIAEDGPYSERGLFERSCGSGMLRSFGGPTPPKYRTEGEVEKVKVFARIRPALRDDETPGALVWSEEGGQLTIFRPDAPVPQSDFNFDKVLGPGASQADVYSAAVSDVVADVLRGYNGTILAYGQTGAGKTYTLGNTAPDAIGMIPRAAAELFSAAARDSVHMYRITMSYIQIYMEMIQDLLNPTADNLPIREDAGGVFVAGACEVPVTSLEECLHYLELGEQNRVFAFTHLNAHSSRSHAVVMLTAVKSRKYLTNEERVQAESPDQDGVVTQKVTVGKLYMVDLAGSERLKKSKSVGLRATEARSINLSLTMLGMCISARAQDSPHVPFRDSKLTRLLQESLGGNAKTSLILCLSDVRQHADESLQSLQFGARAARVCNKPIVNERLQMRQLTAELLAALEEGTERTNGLEAALAHSKEERDALQAALARERARSAAIVEALRAESQAKVEQAAVKLAQQAELIEEHVQQLGQVQQQQGQLEMEVATLREEQRAREEAHKTELAELQQRLAAIQAEAATERLAMEAEARSQQARIAAAAQQQAAALSSQLAQERAAVRDQAASIHLALTRLQRALGELVAGPAAADEGAAATGSAAKRRSGGGRSSDGGGPRPPWMSAGLAAAAAAAVSRRAASSGSGNGDGGGGNSAVQMIQAALGLTGAPSDGESDGDAAASGLPSRSSRGGDVDDAAAGPTAVAIAALVGGGDDGLASGSRRLHASQSLGPASGTSAGTFRDRTSSEPAEAAAAPAASDQWLARTAHRASMPTLSAPASIGSAQQQHQQLLQQASSSASGALNGITANGGGGGNGGRAGSGSQHAMASSEITDIDAALAAAQQDLLEDLRAAAAAATGSGPASAAAGWPAGVGRLHCLTWQMPPAAAAAAAAAASAGVNGGVGATWGVYPGQDAAGAAAARQSSLHGSRSSFSGGASAGAGASAGDCGGGGGYAVEYAAAVASGRTSPVRQPRSYSQLHGPPPAATAANALPAKPPRAHGNAGDCSGGGALRDEASGHSSASVSIPLPSVGVSRTPTPTGSMTNIDGFYGVSHNSQPHSLSTPFMEERVGRHVAAAASRSPTSRDTTAAFAGSEAGRRGSGGGAAAFTAAAAADQRLYSAGTLNLNPAFDTCDSSEGFLNLKEAEALAEAPAVHPPPLLAAAAGDAAASTGPLNPMPTATSSSMALAPLPPPPIFTGIQVQLDALMDMAAALRRVKKGLEARVVAQACELARRQEEQQQLETQSRGDLQASRTVLAAAESQLASTTQELNSVRLVLAETVDELGRTQRELDERSTELDELRRRLDDAAGLYDSALMRMGETRGRLDEALAELEARRGEVARLEAELERTQSDLASERAVLARSQAASARSQAMTTQALAARHELQRQVRAANAIKRAFKTWRLAQLRGQVDAKHRELAAAEALRQEREALQAARAGQALVQESVGAIRDAVGSILAAFVGRRHQLEARKSLQDRMERMLSSGGGSTSFGGGALSVGSGSKTFGGASATGKVPLPGMPRQATTTSAGGAAAAGRSASVMQPPPPPTPGLNRRQLSSPLGLMLSAVTLPQPQPPTPPSASASTAASTGRPTGSVGGGGGGRPQRGIFPPLPLQLPDDAVTTASSTPIGAAARGSVGGTALRSSVGGGAPAATVRFTAPAAAASAGGPVGGGGRFVSGSSSTGGGPVFVSAVALVDDGCTPAAVANGGPCSSSSSCSGVPGPARADGVASKEPLRVAAAGADSEVSPCPETAAAGAAPPAAASAEPDGNEAVALAAAATEGP